VFEALLLSEGGIDFEVLQYKDRTATQKWAACGGRNRQGLDQ